MSEPMSKEDKLVFAILFGGSMIGASIFAWRLCDLADASYTKVEVVYDCRVAEISVDYPPLVKEKCRKLLTPPVRVKG